ncbi:hypothetical protein D9M68_468840 [compost metagenome]
MAQVALEGFHGIEIALGQRIQPRRRRAEGIEQGDLDQVVAVLAGGQETARLAGKDAYAGRAVGFAGELGKAALDQFDHLRIQLHGIHGAGVMPDRLQDVGPGTTAQHQHLRVSQQVERQGRSQVAKVGQRLAPAVIAVERAEPVAIRQHGQLRRRLGAGMQA